MHPLQNAKFVMMLAPISSNDTAATCTAADTLGWGQLDVIALFGAIGAADYDAVNLIESNDDSSYTAAITGTSVTVTQTDDGKIIHWSVPITGLRRRYLKPTIDPGAVACLNAVVGILTRGVNSPASATDAGLLARKLLAS